MQIFAILLVVILAGAGAFWFTKSDTPEVVPPTTPPVTESVPTAPPVPTTPEVPAALPPESPTAMQYKDGTYTSEGTYKSPAGPETLSVTLTLANGVVTKAVVTGDAKNEVSVKLQKAFIDGYTDLVVGKPIDAINLTVVNGASLTSIGFMDALTKIKAQAQV
jgi:uncharacterized protein with FMN-binding domain